MKSIISIVAVIIAMPSFSLSQKLSGEVLAWPPPPQQARIQYLYSFSGKVDVGIEKKWWQKIFDFIAGEEEQSNGMKHPQAIAVNKNGKIYVTDTEGHCVHIFDFEHKEYALIKNTSDAQLVAPVGIAVTNNGRVYVTDSELGKIFVFDEDGKYLSTFSSNLRRPCGISIKNDVVYVTDVAENQIIMFSKEGKELSRFGARGAKNMQFNYPLYLSTTNGNNALYVVDAMNFRLQILNTNGTFISSFGKLGDGVGNFARPKGVALDSDEHIYVVDALFDIVQIFDQQGDILMAFGGSGNDAGRFYLPAGLTIDSNNKIYIADSGNSRVQVFQYLK